MATNNSGKDVEKANKMNPTVVFPIPVISAILEAFVIVESLALPRINKATIKTTAFTIGPSCSNNVKPQIGHRI